MPGFLVAALGSGRTEKWFGQMVCTQGVPLLFGAILRFDVSKTPGVFKVRLKKGSPFVM